MIVFELRNLWFLKGGIINLNNTVFDAYNAALAKFSSEVTDPKAAVIGSYESVVGQASVMTTSHESLTLTYCLTA